jgi:hypothetical protein
MPQGKQKTHEFPASYGNDGTREKCIHFFTKTKFSVANGKAMSQNIPQKGDATRGGWHAGHNLHFQFDNPYHWCGTRACGARTSHLGSIHRDHK